LGKGSQGRAVCEEKGLGHVSSTEKTNTKRDLTRAMVKILSKTQEVTMDVQSGMGIELRSNVSRSDIE